MDKSNFDFIVVGGGTAGCVLANRLSESGNFSVALLEAGGEPRSPWINIPAGFYKLLTNAKYNWGFVADPEPATNNRFIDLPRGRGLGGSTLINGMIYVRGQPEDYDSWAEDGCDGWDWNSVLPIFRALESWKGVDKEGLRGTDGPLPVREIYEKPKIAEAWINAGVEQGYKANPDYNGKDQTGFGYYQVNQHLGERFSAERSHLRPARERKNLNVFTNFHATRIQLDGIRAQAVEGFLQGKKVKLEASREIILSAGAFQSPQLLELSGIGRADVLNRLGIDLIVESPGVGENYMDHFCTRMSWRSKKRGTLNEQTRGLRLAKEVLKYGLKKRGVLTFGTGLGNGFVKTSPELPTPDVQYFFMHASYDNAATRKLHRFPGMTLGVSQLRPSSSGSVHIQSTNPFEQPSIVPNFLHTQEDRDVITKGMQLAREIMNNSSMNEFRDHELTPGESVVSNEDWLKFARENGQTIYHACGTCKMGSDSMSVVDPTLKVKGAKNLRVVDASVMPSIVSGNTQACVFMIAEKASNAILSEHD